jgi:hypothetical protein
VKVNKPSRYFALSVDKHHQRQPHLTHYLIHFTHHLILSEENEEQLQNLTTKILAKLISNHGHLVEHQELTKRRSRAARKEKSYQWNKIKRKKGTRSKIQYLLHLFQNFSK